MNRYHLVAPALAVLMATGRAFAASPAARAEKDDIKNYLKAIHKTLKGK